MNKINKSINIINRELESVAQAKRQKRSDYYCTLSIKTQPELKEDLQTIARGKGLNLSDLVRIILENYVRSEKEM